MRIINAKDITKSKGAYLIYAAPGVGKTTALGSLPGKTLVLDVDRTTGVLKGKANIDIAYIDNVNTMVSWENALQTLLKGHKYDNIAVDNISELERCILSEYGANGKNDGVPAMGDYQRMQFKLVNSLRLLKSLNANIILTAWENMEQVTAPTGEQYSRFIPKIQAKICDNICGLCDVVAHLEITSEGVRACRLEATKNIYAKNQIDERKGCKAEEVIING